MASALLETIINQTLHPTFGGSEKLEESMLKGMQTTISAQQQQQPQQQNGGAITSGDSGSTLLVDLAQIDAAAAAQSADMGQYERLFWILIFLVMVLVAAGGNTIVVFIVSTNKEMKSVTNYFLVNLSLADTMVSTLNVIFNFISMLHSHWPFGKLYCKISNFIAILSISASIFTLTAISCDRYNAILHPLRPRMSHSHAIGWILLIWTLSSALAMPNAFYSTLVEVRSTNDNVALTCTMIWPDGKYPTSSYDHIYNIVILVVTYLVPILTMAILYYKVGRELWGSEAIGENIDKQQRALLAKKKIVKMMIVVVIIFALCWLPYHAFFVVSYYVPTIFQDMPLHYQRCYLFMYWLAMSNSMYNPIIIYFMNSKFRHEFKKVLCFICCCRIYSPPSRVSNNNNNNTFRNNNQSKKRVTSAEYQQTIVSNPRSATMLIGEQHHNNDNQSAEMDSNTQNSDNANIVGCSKQSAIGDYIEVQPEQGKCYVDENNKGNVILVESKTIQVPRERLEHIDEIEPFISSLAPSSANDKTENAKLIDFLPSKRSSWLTGTIAINKVASDKHV